MLSLSDIAEFNGIGEQYLQKLSNITLGRAPQIGEQQSYTSIFLSSVLRKALNEVPTDLREEWQIKIPSKVTIKNEGFRLNSETVESKLKSHWARQCAECRFVVMNLITPQIPQELQKFPWELRLNETLPRGQFAVPVEVREKNEKLHLFWVRGQVQVMKEVPVTTRAIGFGERFTKDDFKMDWKDVTFAYDSAPSAEQLVGRRVSRSLRNGETIFNGVLEREKALKRGDLVRVVLTQDNWKIVMNAVAEEDGFVGDTIKVRNDRSKKQISGIVTADGEVVVR